MNAANVGVSAIAPAEWLFPPNTQDVFILQIPPAPM